jgi:site-specific recombinase XerD
MSNTGFFAFAGTRRRMYAGPLGSHIDDFIELLQEQGYDRHSIRCKIRSVANFSRWLDRQDWALEDVDPDRVRRFLSYRKRSGRYDLGDNAAVRQMTDLLRRKQIVPAGTSSSHCSEREQAEEDFRQHLLQWRGLSRVTVSCYQRCVSRFLRARFADGPIRFDQLTATDVTDFIQRNASGYSFSRGQQGVTALRAFLGHLLQRGKIAIDLSASVPKLAYWSLERLPAYLRADQVAHILEHCDRATGRGRRDFAILLLLARLGLRAGEVAALRLDDVNWEQGFLTIRGKGSRWARMPLPRDVGEAIVDYLVNRRPACPDRRIFLRAHAPQRGFRGATPVSIIASHALVRARIDRPRVGAHIFRHSLATEMLRQGSSLAEIGDVLRHQHPDTTRIYAKVNLSALRELAMPWPGGAR